MILLDTHVVLWWLADDNRLGPLSRQRIADRTERIRVSPVSIFEAETQRRMGKLEAPAGLPDAVAAEGFEWLGLDAVSAHLAGTIEWTHRDSFDRLLVAQARTSHTPLMTADARILGFDPTALDANS